MVIQIDQMEQDKIVQPFINSKTFYSIRPSIRQNENRFFMKSQFRLEDSLFKFFEYLDTSERSNYFVE